MKKYLLFLPILSGLLLGISFIFLKFGFLIWVAFLPLLFYLNIKNISLKRSFFAGLLAGFIFLSGTLFWFFDALPLSWLNIESNFLGNLLLSFLWLLLILILASFVGFFSLSYCFLRRRNFLDIFLVPALWIIFEYLRAWAFGLLYFGEGSLLGPHWTFGNLAYALAQNQSFRLLASIGGIYLVSFLVVLTNVLILFYIKKSKKIIFLIFGLILLSYSLSLAGSSPERPILKIAVLQTKFFSVFEQTPGEDLIRFQIQQNLAREAFRLSPDLDVLVLPEGARFLFRRQIQETLNQISDKEFLIIDSAKSIASLFNEKGESLAEYGKLLLVPYGDYMPYLFEWLARIINNQWLEKLEDARGSQRGEKMALLSDGKFFQGGVLFCSEVLSPVLYRQATQKGAQVLFNLGSLAFSRGSKLLDSQTQAMLQMRAAENGRYLVRSTNFGTSYIINYRGEIIKKTQNLENQVLHGEVGIIYQKTFYTKYGDWILILAGFMFLTFLLFRGIFFCRTLANRH